MQRGEAAHCSTKTVLSSRVSCVRVGVLGDLSVNRVVASPVRF